MGDSFTLILSGTSFVLEAHYFPPIELLAIKNYTLGLVELLTFKSIPNIDEGKNKFYVVGEVITIPTGSYEFDDIENYLQEILSTRGISISLKPNNNTLCSEIKYNRSILVQKIPLVICWDSHHAFSLPMSLIYLTCQ